MQLFMDIECYINYFLVMFSTESGKVKAFEMYEDHPLDIAGLGELLSTPEFEYVTFNGNGYDMPMLSLALSGASTQELKRASDDIIQNNLRAWDFFKKYGVTCPEIDHIDLIEVAPGQSSLKIYGGRMNCPTLQDLPIEHDAHIDAQQREQLKKYCRNDLRITQMLYNALSGQIQLRRAMSRDIGTDLRSKSDAQIAEAVLKKRVYQAIGVYPKKQVAHYDDFTYTPPAYIRFATSQLQEILSMLTTTPMKIKATGHVEMPPEIDDASLTIGNTAYKMGIGGLHSQEKSVSRYADDKTILVDRDVVSYYPNLMLNMGMFPHSLGDTFLTAYRNILDERVTAKRSGEKVKADSLKITLNGTFGKTSNKYSILYNPSMMIHTTLTGQLSLLMLIEALELRGIPVVSANTDGIVIACPVEKKQMLDKIIARWEKVTNLETEETQYKSLHSRDVNSYIAIKPDGSVKTKGFFATSGLNKNPENEVCVLAVVEYLTKSTPVEQTVTQCKDITKFLTLRTVQGGAFKEGYELGKAIRWYHAVGTHGVISYKTNGNSVPRTEGAKPLMVLDGSFPDDVDYGWYINECKELLMDIGVLERPIPPKLPRKNSKAWKTMVQEGKIDATSGKLIAQPQAI